MEDPVVPLERNLYGHPLAGLLWERQFEKVFLENGWEKVPNWECSFVNRERERIILLPTWVELISDQFDRLLSSPQNNTTSQHNTHNDTQRHSSTHNNTQHPPTPKTFNACVGASVRRCVCVYFPLFSQFFRKNSDFLTNIDRLY